MLYRLTWWLALAVYRLLFRSSQVGAEHVPLQGAVLIATNHVSHLDPPMVATSLWRPLYFMAKEELFRHRLFGAYIRAIRAFPVRRGAVDRAAIRQALEFLEHGEGVVIFPEGTRGDRDEPGQAEMGIGLLAVKSGAPVVPGYIWGTREAWGRGRKLKPCRVGIRYGPPLQFHQPEGMSSREAYEQAAEAIMAAIRRLHQEHLASGPP